jgi:phosphoribosylaminoimidazole-succinocarboxamide synthase
MDEAPTFGDKVEAQVIRAETEIKDVMRRVSRALEPAEADALDQIKTMGNHLYAMIDGLGASREISLAKTKLEEAVMWASKHITAPKL